MRRSLIALLVVVPATAAAGPLDVALSVETNVSEGVAFDQVSIAPDVTYGATDALTVGVFHSTFALTGFRGLAGGGLCVTGDDVGCPNVYDNVGAEAWYVLARGAVTASAVAGVHATSLDKGWAVAKLGAKLRLDHGRLFVVSQPSVHVAATLKPSALQPPGKSRSGSAESSKSEL